MEVARFGFPRMSGILPRPREQLQKEDPQVEILVEELMYVR